MNVPSCGTFERWAFDYVNSESLAAKLAPPPDGLSWEADPPRRVLHAPGRPTELRVKMRAEKKRGLGSVSGRARALHKFFHHELQAAELMAWAVLAYADAPPEFRKGLVRIAADEIRHMQLYRRRIEEMGFAIGEFSVRDWFWERVPSCAAPIAFVSVMGLGVESANLEHTATFAERFRAAGDEEGARIQELIGKEEIAHVRFGVRWFEYFERPLDFETWCANLPPPLSPLLMRGTPIRRDARRKSGQPERFIDELESWKPIAPGF